MKGETISGSDIEAMTSYVDKKIADLEKIIEFKISWHESCHGRSHGGNTEYQCDHPGCIKTVGSGPLEGQVAWYYQTDEMMKQGMAAQIAYCPHCGDPLY